jgi:DUF1365 family protein
MTSGPAIYRGTVTHRRLRPILHDLRYEVASLLVDIDDLAGGRTPALLSHNRFNLFSIHDRDHGEEAGSIRNFAWDQVRATGLDGDVKRILMLVYPRILGYAFNPLTAYYALDASDRVRLMIYEVHNTFGGRHTYVTKPDGSGAAEGDTAYGVSEKVFRVSPFNAVEGQYGLRATVPGERLSLGVSLATTEGPLLKAYFTGKRHPLTSRGLLAIFVRLPFQSLKVVGGIHWEALKLWLKGLNLQSPP